MGFLSWIIFGFLAGGIARLVMPGDDRAGCLVTIILGIVGAAVGGWIATQLGWGSIDGFDFRSLIIAILGSCVLLLGFRLIRGRR